MKKAIIGFLVTILLIYVTICSAFYLMQEQLLFHTARSSVGFDYNFDHPFNEEMLSTADNEEINLV